MSSNKLEAKSLKFADLQDYWRGKLAKLPALKLPLDYPRPPFPSYLRSRETLDLDGQLLSEIKRFCDKENLHLFTFLLLAYKVILLRYTGTEDVLVGSLSFESIRIGTEGVEENFVNPVGLRTDLGGDPNVKESLARVAKTVEEASKYRDYPIEDHLDFLRENDELAEDSMFQVMFILRDVPLGSSGTTISDEENSAIQEHTVPSDLSLIVSESQGALTLECDYDSELFESTSINRILEHFEVLLPSLLTNFNQAISGLPILSKQQKQQILVKWNETQIDYSRDMCLHQLFEAQAVKTPSAIAVEFNNQTISYGDLNARATQLAHHLQSLGVGPGTFVGLFMERSLDISVALLGILKAGGAYVPLDPAFPSERLAFMVENSGLNILLTQQALVESLPSDKPTVVCIDSDWETIARATVAPPTEVTSKDLAYVIYTSGSTGVPKGVEIFHGAVVNFLTSMAAEPGLTAEDTLLSVTTLSFDISVLEIFLPLTVGAKVLLVSQEVAADGAELHQVLINVPPTVMQATPATWRMLIAAGWEGSPNLRIFCGGEALSLDLAEKLILRGREVWNLYGPTETTIWSARWRVESGEKILIGRPIANTEIYLLDKHLQPVPIGVAGELHIGGRGLARGYLKRPELTEEKFIAHPFSDDPADRLYKTGDLARYLPDGNIECLGRLDFQVKVRGFRIELGEIETALCQISAIREAVVTACDDAHGEKRLVAYFVANDEQPVTISKFREHLQATLPTYMVPTAFVPLENLPLTPNGKVDRKALPTPDSGVQLVEEFSAPRNATEETLVKIWAEVLQVDQVGIDDNFFELGGHSLLAMQLAKSIRSELSVDIAVQAIFELQNIRELAVSLGPVEDNTLPQIIHLPENHPKPLSFAQQGFWLMDKLHPNIPQYNIPTSFKIVGALDTKALSRALNTIVGRHEILRTNYQSDDNGDGVPLIQDTTKLLLSTIDLSLIEGAEQSSELAEIMEDEAQKPFNLASDLMLRVCLIKLSMQTHILLVTTYHIATDGWSMEILNREIGELYTAYANNSENPLPPLTIRYSDYAVWEQSWVETDFRENLVTFWKEQLRGLPNVHNFPLDRQRPAVTSFQGLSIIQSLPKKLLDDLNILAQAQGASLFMLLHAGLAVLLSRYSGDSDIVIGSPVANREHAELEPVVGCFMNTLVLRSNLSGDPTFTNLLSQSKAGLLAAYDHQQLPFELLIDELKPERSRSISPLFQVMLVMQKINNVAPKMEGLTLSSLLRTSNTAKYDFTLEVFEGEDELTVRWEYATDLFEASTIERLAANFEVLLNGIITNPDCHISTVPLLTEKERYQILTAWNDTEQAYPKGARIHTLFEAQVEQTPEKPAVVHGDMTLSYKELNAKANQLSHYLMKQGLPNNILVGVCVERSIEMIICILGILKAGGAYVPLDPSFPSERLAFMIKDSGLQILLSQQALFGALPSENVQVIYLDKVLGEISNFPLETPAVNNSPMNLAYVIYTSGSTGLPKGVEIFHQGVVNFLKSMERKPGLVAEDTLLSVTTLSFDISVLEIFLPLVVGATVVLVSQEVASDGVQLHQVLTNLSPTVMQATPATWRMLIAEGWGGSPKMRIFCGGEALNPELAKELLLRGRQVWNLYGPTETTIWSATMRVEPNEKIVVGRPIANTQVYILDKHLQPVPIGVSGELHIGGDGLARGYLNQPEITAEKFIAHPFSDDPVDRLYKTGDLARYLPNGNIECLGRLDFQVKVRGFRIELGDIETALSQISTVREVVVIVSDDSHGEKRLVAYVVPNEGQNLKESDLRGFLRDKLPAYMIPTVFVRLEVLPLTPNGKVDRKALPNPTTSKTEIAEDSFPPKSEIEIRLVKIWENILDRTGFGIRDSFFDLGGHSLLAVRLLSQIKKQFGKNLPMTALYEDLTIERLALLIQEDKFVESSSLLVSIQTKGTKLPFYFTGLNGGFLPRNLSRYMGDSQPFYALLSESLDEKIISHFTAKEMAARLISEIQTVQPEGPYLLGGFCGQAVVTFEMAHQLQAQGHKVALLALFEEIAPGKRSLSYTLYRRVYRDVQRIKNHMGNLLCNETNEKINYMQEMVENLKKRIATKIRRKIAKENYNTVLEVSALQVRKEDRDRALRTKLWESYVPKVYPGPITLFVGSDVKYSHDPQLGWGELTVDGVDVQVVHGNHTDMLREPHIQILAEKLTACLTKAQVDHKEK